MKNVSVFVFALLAMFSSVLSAQAKSQTPSPSVEVAVDPFATSQFSTEFWSAFKAVAKAPLEQHPTLVAANKGKLSQNESQLLVTVFDRNFKEADIHTPDFTRLANEIWALNNPRSVNSEDGMMAWQIPWHVHLKAANSSSTTFVTHVSRGGEVGSWNKSAREQALLIPEILRWIKDGRLEVKVINGLAQVSPDNWETPAGKGATREVKHILKSGPNYPCLLFSWGKGTRNRLGKIESGNLTYTAFPENSKSEVAKFSAPLWQVFTTCIIPAGKVEDDEWIAPTEIEASTYGYAQANPLAKVEKAEPAKLEIVTKTEDPKPQPKVETPEVKPVAQVEATPTVDPRLAETEAKLAKATAELAEMTAKLAEAQKPVPPAPIAKTEEPKPEPKVETPKVEPVAPQVETTKAPATSSSLNFSTSALMGVVVAMLLLAGVAFAKK